MTREAGNTPDKVSAMLCGIDSNGELECNVRLAVDVNFTRDEWLQSVPKRSDYVAIELDRWHLSGCALTVGGLIDCWGERFEPLCDDNCLREPGEMATVDVEGNGRIAAPAIEVYGPRLLELFWQRPDSGSLQIAGYEITRNGTVLTTPDLLVPSVDAAAEKSFLDDTVQPGVDYSYSIQAIAINGDRGEPSPPITVNTASDGALGYAPPAS